MLILLCVLVLAVLPAANPSWSIVIPPPGEPGEPMILSGVIYAADGSTPVAGALLSVFHTDARGYYNNEGATAGGRSETARLRGVMRTDSAGRYEFRTIRPASYPGTRNPSHVHGSLQAPGAAERMIEEYHFAGDPFLSEANTKREQEKGRFSPVVTLARGPDGIWRGSRDIRIGVGS